MTEQLIIAIQQRAWWPVVGLAAALVLQALRVILPAYWEAIPTRWKPVPALALVLLASLADAFVAGQTWQVSIVVVVMQVLTAWPTAVGAADAALRMSGTKASSLDTLERQASRLASEMQAGK